MADQVVVIYQCDEQNQYFTKDLLEQTDVKDEMERLVGKLTNRTNMNDKTLKSLGESELLVLTVKETSPVDAVSSAKYLALASVSQVTVPDPLVFNTWLARPSVLGMV